MARTVPQVANTLAEAGPRDLVHVDRAGRVRSRARSRALNIGYWGMLSVLVGIEGYLGYELFGWPGLSLALVLGGYVGWVFSRVAHLRRGLGLMVQTKLEESEAAFEKVAQARLVPNHLRSRAWGGLSSVARLRGDDELALKRIRASIRLRRASKRPLAVTSRHVEASLLARLDRIDEARAVMAELPDATPEGEYIKLSYYTTQLYIAFRDGRHHLGDDELHEQASFALGITSAAPLLALLGWAFEQNGDSDMFTLLGDEARDRHPGDLLSTPMPMLQQWLDGEDVSRVKRVRVEATEPDELAAGRRPERDKRYLR